MIAQLRATARGAVINSAAWMMTKAVGPGGWLSASGSQGPPPAYYPTNWFQRGMALPGTADVEAFGPVASCINIISQDLSRIPLLHVSRKPDKSWSLVTGKAPARIFRKPNQYQTIVDFLLYLGWSLLSQGNFYGVAQRNNRGEAEAIYPIHPRACWPYIGPEGEVFYRITGDPTADLGNVDVGAWYPARDVLHVRLHTPKHPLIGQTPLVAAQLPALTGIEINEHTAAFFHNMSRPSGVLSHPGKLDEAAMARVKERWMQLTQNRHTGEPAVLAEGMSWNQLDMTAVDSELAAIYQINERQIFQIYRVPGFLVGDTDKASFGSSVESLIRFYLQSCLSFYENLIEKSLTQFFRLPSNEEIKFNVDEALLSGDFKERMDAYSKAIQNAVFTPDEARAREGLSPVEHGDKARVQQQLVPLSYGAELQPPNPGASGQGAAPEETLPTFPGEEDTETDTEKALRTYQTLRTMVTQ